MPIKDYQRFETHLTSLKSCISKHNNSLINRGDYNVWNLQNNK